MLPKNLKQPNSFHITKNPRMILGGKFIGAIDIKCLNTWSNIALIIADSYSRASESRSHCIHWDHPNLSPSIAALCQFYNLPILATPWIHRNGMTRHRLDCSNIDLSTQRFTAHRLYSYVLISVRIYSILFYLSYRIFSDLMIIGFLSSSL